MLGLARALSSIVTYPSTRHFYSSIQKISLVQDRVLFRVVTDLSTTWYGKQHLVHSSDSYECFKTKIPLVDYSDIQNCIEWQKTTGESILTSKSILSWETTSGSSGASKSIPYTRSLKKAFNSLALLWIQDLLSRGPRFETGRIYISISPRVGDGVTESSFRKDTDYLSPMSRFILSPFLVDLSRIQTITDPDVFFSELTRFLANESNLEIISIWHPSFLHSILRLLELFSEQEINEIWPKLKFISCWTSGTSSPFVQAIQKKIPNVIIQGKGLISTEAPVTFPSILAKGFLPLYTHIFMEFENTNGLVFRLHELELGYRYKVIISNTSGLYRYRTHDEVMVTHFYNEMPCFEFICRDGLCTDMVGEKLTEAFVFECFNQLNIQAYSIAIPCKWSDYKLGYLVLLDVNEYSPSSHMEQKIECQLLKSYGYRKARSLKQLESVQVKSCPGLVQKIQNYYNKSGIRLGDLKCPLIFNRPLKPEEVQQIFEIWT